MARRSVVLIGMKTISRLVVAGLLLGLFPTAAVGSELCRGRQVTIIGTAGDDTIDGTPRADVISGLDGTDTIRGGGGDDVICGGKAGDQLFGDEGNDFLRGHQHGDHLFGGEGRDILLGGRREDRIDGGLGDDRIDGGRHPFGTDGDVIDYSNSSQGVEVDLTRGSAEAGALGTDAVSGIEVVNGSAFDDILVGDREANLFHPGLGNDQAFGNAGPDQIYEVSTGGSAGSADGDDHIEGGEGDDDLKGGGGSDQLDGGGGDDQIGTVDHIVAADLGDVMTGGPGDDEFEAGPGNDAIDGGEGADTISFYYAAVGVQVDLTAGTSLGHGVDQLVAVEGVFGSRFTDSMTGTEGANSFFSLGGADEIEAGGGDDDLIGNMPDQGVLRMLGGQGSDHFHMGGCFGAGCGETVGDAELRGEEGDDIFSSMAGGGLLDGGAGADLASYDFTSGLEDGSMASVVADLSLGTAQLRKGCSDPCRYDRLVSIENLEGGPGPDLLIGDEHDNELIGGPDDDELRGGAGLDAADGGWGQDVCLDSEQVVSCELRR